MKFPSKTSCVLLLVSAATLRAEFTVGHGAVVLDSSVTLAYDSNIRAASDNTSDWYLVLFPELRYRRVGGRFNTDVSTGIRFKRYQDNTGFNSEDANAHFHWEMLRAEGETTGAALDLGYVETSDAVVEVNDQVRGKNFSASSSGEVLMAGRNLLSAGLTYHDKKHNIGSDQKSAGGRLGYSYVGMPNGTILSVNYAHQRNETTDNSSDLSSLDQQTDTASFAVSHPFYADLVVGASYGYRWLNRGSVESALALPDQQGPVYDLTLKGPFLPKQYFPKTTGTFRLAYEQSDVPGLNDASRNRLVGLINLSWAARERTTLSVFASRTQELTVNDLTVVNASTGFKVTQAIGDFVTTNLDLRYTQATFVNLARKDDRYEAQLTAAYQVNRAWSAQLAYRYMDSQSNTAIADYNRHLVMLTLHYVL